MALFEERRLHLPKPFRTFGVSDIEDALRLLQSGRALGKMAIEMRSNDVVRVSQTYDRARLMWLTNFCQTILQTKPDYYFDSNSSFVIAGGLGGLGRSIVRWMAKRGVKNLILLSRSGPQSKTARELIEELSLMNVRVHCPPCDVTDAAALGTEIDKCTKTMPPIRGCIQASMHLRDAILENMSFQDWQLALAPKVNGTWNLHTALPRGMDFFICLSSVTGIIGSGGLANYAAGNTYLDAFVRYRVSQGEKATSLDLGWMLSEGVMAENSHLASGVAAAGFLKPISSDEFHALLDYHCDPNLRSNLENCQAIIGLETPATMQAKGLPEPQWMQRRTFLHLQEAGSIGSTPQSNPEKAIDYSILLRDAATPDDRAQIVTDSLVRKLSKALNIPPEDIDVSKPLHTYGVDSLLAVELRNYFAKEMGADLAIFEIMDGSNFKTVSMAVARKSRFVHATPVDASKAGPQ